MMVVMLFGFTESEFRTLRITTPRSIHMRPLFVLLILMIGASTLALGQSVPPRVFTYQGVLIAPNGNAVPDGTYSLLS